MGVGADKPSPHIQYKGNLCLFRHSVHYHVFRRFPSSGHPLPAQSRTEIEFYFRSKTSKLLTRMFLYGQWGPSFTGHHQISGAEMTRKISGTNTVGFNGSGWKSGKHKRMPLTGQPEIYRRNLRNSICKARYSGL